MTVVVKQYLALLLWPTEISLSTKEQVDPWKMAESSRSDPIHWKSTDSIPDTLRPFPVKIVLTVFLVDFRP